MSEISNSEAATQPLSNVTPLPKSDKPSLIVAMAAYIPALIGRGFTAKLLKTFTFNVVSSKSRKREAPWKINTALCICQCA
jgi:hypothetical protein